MKTFKLSIIELLVITVILVLIATTSMILHTPTKEKHEYTFHDEVSGTNVTVEAPNDSIAAIKAYKLLYDDSHIILLHIKE